MGWIKDLINKIIEKLDAANIDGIKFKYGIPIKHTVYPAGYVALRPRDEMPIEPGSVGRAPQAGKKQHNVRIIIGIVNRDYDEALVDEWAHEHHHEVMTVCNENPGWEALVSDSFAVSRMFISDIEGDYARSAVIVTVQCRKRI